MKLVVLGLSLSSSWGNGHATTWRSLIAGLSGRGHEVLFLERDVPWYAAHRDLDQPGYCRLELYADLDELKQRWAGTVRDADAVLIGSYVPDGVSVAAWVHATARGLKAFYDIDTPLTLAGLETGTCSYLEPAQVADFDVYLSFTGGPVLRILEEHWGARLARPLYCSVDPALYRPLHVERRWAMGYLGTWSADREAGLQQFLIEPAQALPGERFVVAGALYPATTVWPANIERIEHLPPPDHAAFYAAQRLTLNVTRQAMAALGHSPSVRLFEAAACGVAIASDPWPGLDALFRPSHEILLVERSQDVVDLLGAAQRPLLESVGAAARQRALTAHTGAARAGELERHLGETRALRARRARRRPVAQRTPANGHGHAGDEPMSPRPLRVLVTGGSGFIGSHLVERLLGQGNEVLCLDSFITGSKRNVRPFLSNPRFQLIEADVARALPPVGRLDAIYNLACPASPRHYQRDPIHTMRTCVLGALNLLELARSTGARILQASTSEIYGNPVLHPQPESYLGNVNPVGPRACYDEGKRAAETLFADYARRHGVKVRIARIFNTYGPRLRPEDGRVVSNFIVQALTGRPLTVFGAGHQTRSLCYIDDLVDGLLALMNGEVEPIEPINFGNPEERSVLTIARLVLELTGSSSPIEHRPLPVDDPQRRRPVIDRARAQLGWQPRVTIEDGLARTIDFFAAELGIGRYRSRALPSHARGSSPTDLIEIPLAG